jgi:hypothetical protein
VLNINRTHVLLFSVRTMYELNKNLLNPIYIIIIPLEIPDFPDEDLCSCKNIPSLQNLIFTIKKTYSSPCSCLMLWIERYNRTDCMNKEDYFKCNFSQMTQNCFIRPIEYSFRDISHLFTNKGNIYFFSAILKIITSFLVLYFGILGCVLNGICVFIFLKLRKYKNKSKKMDSILLKIMISYSILNIIFCFISTLHVLNSCPVLNGKFCSPLLAT